MIWGFDFAKLTGYAVLDGPRLVDSGTWSLEVHRGDPEQRRYLRVFDELTFLEKNWGAPTGVGYERYAAKGYHTITQLAGYWACLMAWCESYSVTATPIAPATFKKLAIGHGHATKEQSVAAFVRRWGVEPVDHNAADAAHVAWVVQRESEF